MGKTLFLNEKVSWLEGDLTKQPSFEPHDLLLISYAFAEMSDASIARLIPMMWEATRRYFVIIEPGTPAGFARVKKIREQLISLGAHCVAPCTHSNRCPMEETIGAIFRSGLNGVLYTARQSSGPWDMRMKNFPI